MTDKEMLQEAKEWQKHIRNLIAATDDELYHKRSKVFDWLIKQAEKVQELENELKIVNEDLEILTDLINSSNYADELNQEYERIKKLFDA